ncbi:MAG: dihydrolipoyl dehydrogenase family protein [Acidimicrobiales bacterium]
MTIETEFLVVGGGAAGLAASRAALRRGKRVLLASATPLGGDCTFHGCVPSKTLLASSRQGLSFTESLQSVRRMVEKIASTEDESVLRSEGATVMLGDVQMTSTHTAIIAGESVRFDRAVIATGSSASLPPIPGLNEIQPLTNETIFDLTEAPHSLTIIGGGPMGCELAQAFAHLGVAVTILEGSDRLLGREEPEASELIHKILTEEGISIQLNATIHRVSPGENGDVTISFSQLTTDRAARSLSTTKLLVAAGRRARSTGFGLEDIGVRLDSRGFVLTNDYLRTNQPSIFAAGDVTGRMLLTHAGDEMGRIAAHNAFSANLQFKRFSSRAIPWATYTSPEVARVGLSETEAAAYGGRVAYLPLEAIDRAKITGATAGFIKIITGPIGPLRYLGGGRVIGATIVAPHAGEMIHELALAVQTRMFAGRLAQTVHAYPTLSIGIRSAVAQFFYAEGGQRCRPAESNR